MLTGSPLHPISTMRVMNYMAPRQRPAPLSLRSQLPPLKQNDNRSCIHSYDRVFSISKRTIGAVPTNILGQVKAHHDHHVDLKLTLAEMKGAFCKATFLALFILIIQKFSAALLKKFVSTPQGIPQHFEENSLDLLETLDNFNVSASPLEVIETIIQDQILSRALEFVYESKRNFMNACNVDHNKIK